MNTHADIESTKDPSEIIASKVSVYEIMLDLKDWKQIGTAQVPDFYDAISKAIASIKEHKCMTGQPGGFLSEVLKGTNFAHVIEHVILELIHLADPEKKIYTGWTRKKEKHTFIIHYSAPDFLTGRLAAILGVDFVKRLIRGEKPDQRRYVALLKDPLKYFTQDKVTPETLCGVVEPCSVIDEMAVIPSKTGPVLSEKQETRIRQAMVSVEKEFPRIDALWKTSFFKYSGDFGKSIVDKMELVNADKFMDQIVHGDFESLFRGIQNVSHVISSYRIPISFVVHSIWLYKNILLEAIITRHESRQEILHPIIQDMDHFFQALLQSVSQGSSMPAPGERSNRLRELQEFRELRKIREGKGGILVVDDDEVIRNVMQDILTHEGYMVLLAQGGTQALRILSEKGEAVSLVILDMLMPDMDGKEVYADLRKRHADMNVLISSGFPKDDDVDKIVADPHVRFIGKPFMMEAFLEKVRSLMG